MSVVVTREADHSRHGAAVGRLARSDGGTDDDGVTRSLPRRIRPPAGNDAEHPVVRRQYVKYQRGNAAAGGAADQGAQQQGAKSLSLPRVGDDQADIACQPGGHGRVGRHAVCDNSPAILSNEQDVGAGAAGQDAQQTRGRRRHGGKETQVLRLRRQAADELADARRVVLATLPEQSAGCGGSCRRPGPLAGACLGRGSFHEPSLAWLAKSVK
jgi:hypothetical protein